MKGKTIKELQIGDSAEFTKTVTEGDVYLYAGVTGDLNPAHINQVASEKTMFKGRIAHGMLTAGFISAVLGTQLPGPGTIYMGQELSFLKPVHFGDTITAKCEVSEIIKDKIVKLKTTATNQNGELVLDGVATVMPPRE
ncbi:MaoC family dehydratase [Peptoniphilus sp.]|uniref:MaoC family dehydratase n=1 Tax=Peptoniphilus sp. TaxID=1971214 RepID=UPI003995CD92